MFLCTLVHFHGVRSHTIIYGIKIKIKFCDCFQESLRNKLPKMYIRKPSSVVICESSAKIYRFFPGFPLNFQDISGIKLGRWGISFLSPEFCTPAGRRTLF